MASKNHTIRLYAAFEPPVTLIDPADLDRAALYRLMISAIVPRPIAWVGTRGGGRDNLAPFSYFMGVASDPPLLAISVARAPGGGLKHTARNILDSAVFSVSIPRFDQLDAVHLSGGAWPGSEFDACGIDALPCHRIDASRPALAPFCMECVLHQALDLGPTHVFFGRVVLFVGDPVEIEPLARLGGDHYAGLGTVTSRSRVVVR